MEINKKVDPGSPNGEENESGKCQDQLFKKKGIKNQESLNEEMFYTSEMFMHIKMP